MFPSKLLESYPSPQLMSKKNGTEIYKARHAKIGKLHCIKVYEAPAITPEEARRWDNEAQLLGRLGGQNVVTTHNAGEVPQAEGGGYYIVMDWIDGLPLDQFMQKRGKPLSPAETVDWAWRIARVLAKAHHEGIIHRDIKPSNLMFIQRKYALFVVLIDFGTALRLHNRTPDEQGEHTVSFGYTAPDDAIAPPQDVYSLGVTMWESLTAQSFAGVHEHGAKPYQSAGRINAIPAELDELIQEMTAKEPEQRPTMADAAARLKAMQGSLEGWTGIAPEQPEADAEAAPAVTVENLRTLVDLMPDDYTLYLRLADAEAIADPGIALETLLRGIERIPGRVELVNQAVARARTLSRADVAVAVGLHWCELLPATEGETLGISDVARETWLVARTLQVPDYGGLNLMNLGLALGEAGHDQASVLALSQRAFVSNEKVLVQLVEILLKHRLPIKAVFLLERFEFTFLSRHHDLLKLYIRALLDLMGKAPKEHHLKNCRLGIDELRRNRTRDLESVMLEARLAQFLGPREALKVWERAYKDGMVSEPVLASLAGLHARLEEWGPAERWARETLQLAPDSARGHAHLGYTLLHSGPPEEALAHLQAAFPGLPSVAPHLAEAKRQTGDYPGAIRLLVQWVLRQANLSEWRELSDQPLPQAVLPALTNLAECLLHMKDGASAITAAAAGLKASPPEPFLYRLRLVRCQANALLGNHGEALTEAKELLGQRPDELRLLEIVAQSTVALGLPANDEVDRWFKAHVFAKNAFPSLQPLLMGAYLSGHHEAVLSRYGVLQTWSGRSESQAETMDLPTRMVAARSMMVLGPAVPLNQRVLMVKSLLQKGHADAEALVLCVRLTVTMGHWDSVQTILDEAAANGMKLLLSDPEWADLEANGVTLSENIRADRASTDAPSADDDRAAALAEVQALLAAPPLTGDAAGGTGAMPGATIVMRPMPATASLETAVRWLQETFAIPDAFLLPLPVAAQPPAAPFPEPPATNSGRVAAPREERKPLPAPSQPAHATGSGCVGKVGMLFLSVVLIVSVYQYVANQLQAAPVQQPQYTSVINWTDGKGHQGTYLRKNTLDCADVRFHLDNNTEVQVVSVNEAVKGSCAPKGWAQIRTKSGDEGWVPADVIKPR